VNALRILPVDWRIFIIVALNGAVLAVLAFLAASGAGLIITQWRDVGAAHGEYRLYAGIESEVCKLQGLVHRYLSTPSGDLLAEIDSRRAKLLDNLGGFRHDDPSINADFARLSGASRRFLSSFDALRETAAGLRRLHEAVVSQRGPEMSSLLSGLESESRAGGGPTPPGLTRAREALFEGLAGFNAFYLAGELAAADRSAVNLELLRRELAALRDGARDERQAAIVDGLTARADELETSLAAARRDMDRRTQLVVEEIDGRQKVMAEVVARLIETTRTREAALERSFLEAVGRLGRQLALVSVVFLSLSAAVSWAIGQSIARPLRRLRQNMAAVAAGDYDCSDVVAEADAPDEIGAMAQVLQVFKDNAQAKRRMELERDEQERRWRLMLETSPVGVSIIRARDLARVYTNPKYDELFALGALDNPTEWPLALSFDDERDARELIRRLNEGDFVNAWEVRRKRRDGVLWWCRLDVRAVDYRGERSFMVWHYDVTERRCAAQALLEAKERAETALENLHEAQESLVQAEKMAALGGLVAGVAHEINTPVGIAVTAASHLVDESESISRKMRENVLRRSDLERFLQLCGDASGRILANAQRAGELIQSFKQVAVDQTYDDRRPFDLCQYLQEVALSLGPRLKPGGHTLTIDCAPGVEVDGMPGALAQVVTNLVVNSVVHGFPSAASGMISLRAEVRRGTGPGGAATGEDEVVLTYADNGVGIPADILPRIFDPFFTTNRAGGGSGLGLNIVYNIVQKKLNGRIAVESAPGDGARFTIVFPQTGRG
jgi:PAS domain S-box-containing protein